MPQVAVPIADNSYNMLGAYPFNGAGERYKNIDNNSTDYIYSQNNPGGAGNAEFQLTSLTDPVSSTGHTLRITHFQIDEDSGPHPQSPNTGGTATSLAWELREGATVRASGSVSPGNVVTTSITLNATQADSISDYTNLRIFLNPGGGGGSVANRRAVAISFVDFQVPDAPTPTETKRLALLGVG